MPDVILRRSTMSFEDEAGNRTSHFEVLFVDGRLHTRTVYTSRNGGRSLETVTLDATGNRTTETVHRRGTRHFKRLETTTATLHRHEVTETSWRGAKTVESTSTDPGGSSQHSTHVYLAGALRYQRSMTRTVLSDVCKIEEFELDRSSGLKLFTFRQFDSAGVLIHEWTGAPEKS
jgi:hypothetical protein